MAAATAFIAWLFTELRSYFHIAAADSAEAAVRTAAATEAGKLAVTIPPEAIVPNATPASLISIGTVQAAAGKVITDLPKEVALTGYTPTDIADMILSNLPTLLGLFNPGLGAVATAVAGAIKKT